MRDQVVFYINGVRHEVSGEAAFQTIGEYLRYVKGLTGTKIVCAEGDCGACTILVTRMVKGKLTEYQSINSCIAFVYLMDRTHMITVEGLRKDGKLHPVQTAMVENQGAQCGYCTPGFICAMAGACEDTRKQKFTLDEKRVKNYVTGNLCRCTGYEPIIKAGCSVKMEEVPALSSLYADTKIVADFKKLGTKSVHIKAGEREAYIPATLKEALVLRKKFPDLRITSGATDLGVVSNKGKVKLTRVMSLNAISELYEIENKKDALIVGAKASLTALEKACEKAFPAFSDYLHIFASPQIKNSGTLVGNLINASPIADTIPFLRVAEAEIVLASAKGRRTVNINQFIKGGYKELDLKSGEMVISVKIPKTKQKFKLYKVSTRRDLDISTVTFAARYEVQKGKIKDFALALGGVGPTVLRMSKIEQVASGQALDPRLFKALATAITQSIKPVSDVRGSSDYRLMLCHNLMLKFGDEVSRETGATFSEVSI